MDVSNFLRFTILRVRWTNGELRNVSLVVYSLSVINGVSVDTLDITNDR